MYSKGVKVPLAASGLRDSDIDLVTAVLRSGNLTMGKEVKHFEKLMCEYLNVSNFIMLNSGSSANLLMFEALLRPTKSTPRLNQGDSVLVPAIAWPTTIWPIIQLGLNPLFVDIDPLTLAIDLTKAQKVIDSSKFPITAIFPIHPLGHAISPSALQQFVEANNLVLINDVCESLGSWREGVHAGLQGIAASFSFYFSHHITTMEGGGVATNDSEFADDLRSMRSHGWSRDRTDVSSWNRFANGNNEKFLFVSTGYNFRPMEIQAVIGSSQIKELDKFVEKRRRIARRVSMAVEGSPLRVIGSESIGSSMENSNSWMLIPIYVSDKKLINMKDLIVKFLEERGIETRPVLTGNFLAQPSIQRISKHAIDSSTFNSAQDITNNGFLVGAHHDLTEIQIGYLCETLHEVSRKF